VKVVVTPGHGTGRNVTRLRVIAEDDVFGDDVARRARA